MLKTHINGYALALFDLAKEEKKLKKYKNDSIILIEAIEDGNEKIIHILNSKLIDQKELNQLIQKIFKGFEINIKNFIIITSIKNRTNYILPSLKKLITLINEYLNIKEGIVYTTSALTVNEIKKMEKKAEKMLGFKSTLKNKLDPELLAGFKIVIEDDVIEDSIISRVHNIKHTLLRGGN